MLTIGRSANDADPARRRRRNLFPAPVNPVMVGHDPVRLSLTDDRRDGRPRIALEIVQEGQKPDLMAARTDRLAHMAFELPAHENRGSSAFLQGIGQREAAHDMPDADLRRGVRAENDGHGPTWRFVKVSVAM